jgi:hypothetical protein
VGCLEFGSEVRVLWKARAFVTISMVIIFYRRTMAQGIKNRRKERQNVKHGIMSTAARILSENLKKRNYLQDTAELGR